MVYNNLAELFTAIANAIRGKTGSADPIVANDFPAAIEGISGGDNSMEDGLIDGTITEYRNDRVESVATKAFLQNKFLERITLPNVKTFGDYAFSGMEKIQIIELGNVTSVGSYALSSAPTLEYLIFRSEAVCADSINLRDVYSFNLLVPRSLQSAFTEAIVDEREGLGKNVTILALEDYTVDGTVTGELDLTKMGL